MSLVDILSPHYDDAVLSAWHQIEEPGTRVITVFGGVPDQPKHGLWDRLSASADSDKSLDVRRAENEAALASTATLALSLDFLDRQYQLFTSSDVAEVADEIEDVATYDTSFLAPLGIGSYFRRHPDHITTRNTGLELLKRGYDVSFYADLPYLLPVRNLEEWPMRLPVEKIKKVLGHPVTIEPHELSEAEQARKREALALFTSQMPMVNKLALGALRSADAYKWEATVRVN